ncbi:MULTISPECIES: hypothetical protein [Clostridium]|uniref:hypothetical protein n=1 Tax=Clostridium TaxID=1485 RepID=UPI00069D9DA2|nr:MULTISPECIES: hypothetical protein [Clostridium]KOF57844.1 hypothetical protein AGR56_16710 [Clostridium sp. DMHC 10]MCD2345073.1 hypothetical protein [Clostridium guangxiense]
MKLKVIKQIKSPYGVFAEPGDIVEYKCGMARNKKVHMGVDFIENYVKLNIFQRIILSYTFEKYRCKLNKVLYNLKKYFCKMR